MLPDRVSSPGPLTYESGALPIALRGPRGGLFDSLESLCDSKTNIVIALEYVEFSSTLKIR